MDAAHGPDVGAEYRITYNFQQGYSYKITITAARIISIGGGPNDKLRLDLNSGGSGNNTSCNGASSIDNSASGNFKQSKDITSTSFGDYEYVYNTVSSPQSYLMVAAIPVSNSASQTIYIRKIKIEITATAELTLSPTSLSLTCGTTTAQTFTVSNPNNVQNITSYEWNLGSSSNGWVYNGSAAPQNISTSTNSISLTPTCGSALSNVSVTVKVNNANYKTYTCTVTLTAPSMSINGSSSICSSTPSSYYINNLPCNASVSWSISPSGIVSPSCTSCSTTSLTKLANGAITLTATITNVCGLSRIQVTKNIAVGLPNVSSADALIIYSQPGDENEICRYQGTTYGFTVTNSSSVIWSAVSHLGGSWPSWNQSDDDLYVEFFTAAQQTLVMNLDASNACGSTTYDFGFVAVDCGGRLAPTKKAFKVSPNPASNFVNVTTVAKINLVNRPIREILVSDVSKNIILRRSFDNARSAQLNIASLKPGIYYLRIISGNYVEVQTFLKK